MTKYQGSRELHVGDVTIGCISPLGNNLLDSIVENCPADIKEGSIDRFLEWVYGSNLIDTPFTLDQIKEVEQQWRNHIIANGLEKYYSVYGCSYWLVRYSGLVQPKLAN
jgi:hypothetical protein